MRFDTAIVLTALMLLVIATLLATALEGWPYW